MIPKFQQGFILVATMSILLLLTLLTMGAAEISLMLSKQTSAQWQFWRASTAARNSNLELVNSLDNRRQPACVVDYQIDNRYWSQPAVDWGKSKCNNSQMGVKTFSVIENIPPDYCIEKRKNKVEPIAFYRITTQTETPQNIVLHVQSVVAVSEDQTLDGDILDNILTIPGRRNHNKIIPRPNKDDDTCTNPISQLDFGMQSWREA